MTAAELPDVLTASQVGEWLQLSPSSVRRAAERGELPGVRIGGIWRFSRDRIASLLDTQAGAA